MPVKRKGKQSSRKFLRKGTVGSSVLYLVILTGALVVGFMFAGSDIPNQRTIKDNRVVVTVIPKASQSGEPNIQLDTFGGVTGEPTPYPTTRPSPTAEPSQSVPAPSQ